MKYYKRIPNSLRDKTINSRISREIFFLDSLNDLAQCFNSNHSYHIIRSSVLLRMLLLDTGIDTINAPYNTFLIFKANESIVKGEPFSNRAIRDNKPQEILREFETCSSYSKIELLREPLKDHSLEEFINKICISIKNKTCLNFSVKNIIHLVANKHGAAHLEAQFDSNELEAFHYNDFNPLSLNRKSQFIICLRDIILIMLNALEPLTKQIEANLKQHDKSSMQYSKTETFKVMSKEESEKFKTRATGNKKQS